MKITDSSYKDYREGDFKDPVDIKPTETDQKEQAIASAISRLVYAEKAIENEVSGDKPITNIQVRLFLNVQNQWVATASGKMTITLCS